MNGRGRCRRVGAFLGLGDDDVALGGSLPSEYGIVPAIVYVSVSVFF